MHSCPRSRDAASEPSVGGTPFAVSDATSEEALLRGTKLIDLLRACQSHWVIPLTPPDIPKQPCAGRPAQRSQGKPLGACLRNDVRAGSATTGRAMCPWKTAHMSSFDMSELWDRRGFKGGQSPCRATADLHHIL